MRRQHHLMLFPVLWVVAALHAAETKPDADLLFHPAARDYIHGLIEEAGKKVDEALALFPDDENLLRLKELIEQREQQPQQDDTPGQPEPSAPPDPSDPGDPEPDPSPPTPAPSIEEDPVMSEEEALRILDAMRQNEQDQRRDQRPILGSPEQVEKDW